MFGKGNVFYKWWCKDNVGLKYFGGYVEEKEVEIGRGGLKYFCGEGEKKEEEIGPCGVVSVDFWN